MIQGKYVNLSILFFHIHLNINLNFLENIDFGHHTVNTLVVLYSRSPENAHGNFVETLNKFSSTQLTCYQQWRLVNASIIISA